MFGLTLKAPREAFGRFARSFRGPSPAGLTVAEFKKGFFDRQAVLNAADAATRKVFSRFGAFTRHRAKRSIRIKPDSAPPFRPPHGHKTANFKKTSRKGKVTRIQTTSPLRELIYFAYDKVTKSVVIGPAYYSRRHPGSPGRAAELIEHGGTGVQTRGGRRKRVKYLPRPFMAPAARVELAQLPALWANSLR